MADMRWTDSQQDAISARRGTVLVAAAAGSGKTAVLVQRAIQRLTDPENPTSADRMLIVTFTKAAAAEMRARLEARLHQMLREDPGDPHLRRQSVLLAQAHIGTVDSFCAEMVREFFHLLDLSPDFKIISDKQEENLVDAALNEALSQAFEEGAVGALADAFAGERDDRRLLEMVLTLYRFMQSHPFPERWLQEKVEMYFPGMAAGAGPSPWERVILDYAGETAAHCLGLLSRAVEECREDPAVEKAYAPALEKDRQALLRLEELARAGDWDGLSQAARDFAPARRGALRGYDGDPLKDRLESFRKEVKRAAGELLKYLAADRAACMREIAQTAPLVKSLQELTLDFSRRYTQKKREGNFLDYSDLEHQAIRLFLGEDGQPTPAAREVAARFDEIMIDEYQDINEVQDSLFRAVSQNGENLFMVGDVKQSIYGFRRAMPEIFLRARRAFPKYRREQDSYPASITLDRNFRSPQRGDGHGELRLLPADDPSGRGHGLHRGGAPGVRGGLRPQGGLPNRAGVHRPPGGRLPRGGRGRLDCPAHPPAGGGRLHRYGQGGGAARHLRGLLRAAAQRQPVRPRLRPRAPGLRGACPGQRGGGLFPGGGDRRHALLAAGDRQPQPGHPPAGGADEPPVRLHRRRRGPPAPGEPGRQRVRLPCCGRRRASPAAPRWSRSWASTGPWRPPCPPTAF